MRKLALVPTDAPEAGVAQLRVAIASSCGKALDSHFGSAKKFVVYDVTPTDSRLVEIVDFSDTSDESGQHGEAAENRIAAKIGALAGCQLLLVLAIGGPVAAKVVKAGVHPIKIGTAEPVSSAIEHVQTMMRGTPPPWLRKLLAPKVDRADRFSDFSDLTD